MSLFARIPQIFAQMPVPARISCLLFFVVSIADGALLPYFAVWAHKVAGIEVQWIGVLLACYAGGELLATPLLGGIADRVGRRPVLLASTAGVGLGFLLLPFTNGPVAAVACLILIGLAECPLHPTAATLIGDTVDPERLTQSFSLMRLAGNAGSMLGPALGALFALYSLRFVFIGGALALLIGTAFVAALLPETRPARAEAHAEQGEEESLTALTALFRDRRLAALLLPLAAIGICSSWVESVSPLYASTAGLLSNAGIGWLFTYAGALGVLLQLPLTEWACRFSPELTVLFVTEVQSLAFVLLLPQPTLALMVGAVSAFALSRILLGPLTHTLAVDMAPAHARASYQAAFSIASDLRDTAGPALGTWLFAFAAVLPWLVALPVAATAGAVLAAVVRGLRQARERSADLFVSS